MPIRYEVDPARGLVVATAEGVVTEADLLDYVTSVLANPDIRPGFRELVDLRGVTRIEIRPSALVDGVPSSIKEFAQQLRETRTAVVVSEDRVEEVSRLFDLVRRIVPNTIRLFRDMDGARAWLGLAGEIRPSQRRVAPRSAVRIAVTCRMGDQDRSAEIVNLSLSGALLACPAIQPPIGVPVEICWEPPGMRETSELRGTVVRHAEGGFAVRFQRATPELLWLLGDPF
jgi:hypothetical protein